MGLWSVQEPLSPRLATGQSPAGHWSTLPASLLSSFSLSSFSCIAPYLVCISIIIIIIIIGMYGERKMNARCPCTPPSTVETFGEEISAESVLVRR